MPACMRSWNMQCKYGHGQCSAPKGPELWNLDDTGNDPVSRSPARHHYHMLDFKTKIHISRLFERTHTINTYAYRLHYNAVKLILIAILSMLSVPGLALAVELPPLERDEIEYPNMDSRLTHIYNSADEYAIPASTNSMEDRIRVVLVMEYPDAPFQKTWE